MAIGYHGILMEAGNVQWRALSSECGLEEGLKDQRLTLYFEGTLSGMPWITITSYGYAIDLNSTDDTIVVIFNKKWLRGKGFRKVNITDHEKKDCYTIDLQL